MATRSARPASALLELLSPELHLLCSCCKLDQSAADIAQRSELLNSGVDWNRFLKLAAHHGVAALAFRALVHDPAFPFEIREQLRESARRSALRNLALTQELLSLSQLARTNEVALMPHKGPALAARIYGDLGLREASDLDFLIRRETLVPVTALLLDRGYVPEQEIPRRPSERYFNAVCECGFVHPERNIRVEIHWNSGPRHLGVKIEPDWWWSDATHIHLNGEWLPTLSPEKLVLVLCIHGAKHGWERLKWIADIANLLRIKTDLDWVKLRELATESGSERILAVGLQLARGLFEAAIPEGYLCDAAAPALAADCVKVMRASEPGQSLSRRRWSFLLRLHPGWIGKLYAAKLFLLEQETAAGNAPLPAFLTVRPLRRMLRAANVLTRG